MKLLLSTFILSIIACFGYSQETDTSSSSGLVNYILGLNEKIMNDPDLQSNSIQPSDTTTLPVGICKVIGNSIYAICIDSAKYTPEGAFFNAYMALDFPGSDQPIAFEASHIKFNSEGVIGGDASKLYLVSEQVVKIGPHVKMKFKNDGFNFVEWDCTGFIQAGISVDFIFDSTMIINAVDPSKPVTASFKTTVQNLKNFMVSIPSITPFKVKGADDFIFSLTNVVLDRSDSINPAGIVLPQQTLNLYNGQPELWRGFYAQNISVKLPEKLSPEGQRTEIYANQLILDDAGVTGTFGGNNVLDLTAGKIDNWGFSISNMQVKYTCNNLTSGSLSGAVKLSLIKDRSIDYSASISQHPTTKKVDYLFAISPGDTSVYSIPCIKSSITILPTSQVQIMTVQQKFVAQVILNGKLSFQHKKSGVKNIAFQNFTMTSKAPHITNGIFSLTSTDTDSSNQNNKFLNFKVSLNQVKFSLTTENKIKLGIGASMNLGDEPNYFSASTYLNVITSDTINNGRTLLKHQRVEIETISINLNTNAFKLYGTLSVKNDDPVFGDLFYGSFGFRINSVMDNDITTTVGFGKNTAQKYWMVSMSAPVNFKLGSNVKISKLYGGVEKGVKSTRTEQELMSSIFSNTLPTNTSDLPFLPDTMAGLTVRAGIGFEHTTGESTMNGEAMFMISFNANGGFNTLGIYGQVYMMVPRAKRNVTNAKKIYGTLAVFYDHTHKVFDAGINAGFVMPGSINGNVNITFHSDTNVWYLWINRPSNRATLNVHNLFSASAYFQAGEQIDPIPPPPPCITNLLNVTSFSGINMDSISKGKGLATGMRFDVGMDKEFHVAGNWYGFVNASLIAGFDLTMIEVSETAHCVNSTEQIGTNGWYCMGQVYGYINAGVGARRKEDGSITNTLNLFQLQTAFLLQGRFPKPTYVSGAIAVQLSFLTFNVSATVNASFGDNCQIVYN